MRFTWHMMKRSLLVRRSRSLAALAAVIVAATIATVLLNLYADTHAKLAQQFRGYGANIVLSGDALDHTHVPLKPNEVAVPLAFATGQTISHHPLVVVGTDITALMEVNHFWQKRSVSGSMEVVAGAKAYNALGNGAITIGDSVVHLQPGRVITTGDADESRLFIPLAQLRKLAPAARVTTMLLYSPGAAERVNARIAGLRTALPAITVEPVRNVLNTQLTVLGRMHSVMMLASLIIAVIAALSLWASLSAAVLERRKDFAVLKALGASNASVTLLFLLEQAGIGLIGAIAGYVLGCGLSAAIGYYNFQSIIYPHLSVLPWIVGLVAVVVMAGATVPLQRLQKIRPAAILKGE